MGFSRKRLARGNMWLGKRKDKRVRHEEVLIVGWLLGHPWYRVAAVLKSVMKGQS